jgi:hypothetical protein
MVVQSFREFLVDIELYDIELFFQVIDEAAGQTKKGPIVCAIGPRYVLFNQ